MEKKYQTMTITLENVSQSQAIALSKMFKYMEHLGNIGSSRKCSFYSDGDGDFRPKVTIDYPEELSEVPEITGVYSGDDIKTMKITNNRPSTHQGDFNIDPDTIAWKINE
jgi:hypothetical protein